MIRSQAIKSNHPPKAAAHALHQPLNAVDINHGRLKTASISSPGFLTQMVTARIPQLKQAKESESIGTHSRRLGIVAPRYPQQLWVNEAYALTWTIAQPEDMTWERSVARRQSAFVARRSFQRAARSSDPHMTAIIALMRGLCGAGCARPFTLSPSASVSSSFSRSHLVQPSSWSQRIA